MSDGTPWYVIGGHTPIAYLPGVLLLVLIYTELMVGGVELVVALALAVLQALILGVPWAVGKLRASSG